MGLPALPIIGPLKAMQSLKPGVDLCVQEGDGLGNSFTTDGISAAPLCESVGDFVSNDAAVTWCPDQADRVGDGQSLQTVETVPDRAGAEFFTVEGLQSSLTV